LITKVSFDFDLGIPIIPDNIKERVRQGEQIDVEILPQTSGYVQNALTWGVAGLWVDGARIPTQENTGRPLVTKNGHSGSGGWKNTSSAGSGSINDNWKKGRWPANLILDEEAGRLLDEQSGESKSTIRPPSGGTILNSDTGWNQNSMIDKTFRGHADTGGASRFFYTAKASSTERNKGCDHLYWRRDKNVPSGFVQITEKEWQSLPKKQRAEGNVHPTVKPLELLQYLTRLTRTPTGGIVLDPFMGSGSQGKATILENRSFIGIEIEEASFVIAEARIEYTWLETEEGMEP